MTVLLLTGNPGLGAIPYGTTVDVHGTPMVLCPATGAACLRYCLGAGPSGPPMEASPGTTSYSCPGTGAPGLSISP